MARPKKDPAMPDARARLEQAFWDLMEDPGYSRISVGMLADRAGVNHNTIYYHYPGGIENLALSLLEKVIPPELPGFAFAFPGPESNGDLYNLLTPEIMLRWKRFYLFLTSGSDTLNTHARNLMFEALCDYHGLDPDRITSDQMLSLRFIFRGYAALLRSIVDRSDPAAIAKFAGSPLGLAVQQTINELPKRKSRKE